MWPALFRIPLPEFMGGGGFPIRMFGVMVLLGCLSGTWFFVRRLRKVGLLREGATASPGLATAPLSLPLPLPRPCNASSWARLALSS